MSQLESLPPIIDAKQAAEVLHCSPRSVQRLCNEGKLVSCRIGRRYRVNTASLLRFAGFAPAPREEA